MQPGDVPAEVVGVGADVAEAAGRPGLLRVGPPRRLLLVARSRAASAASPGCSNARIALISPSSPFSTISRACRTSG